MPKNLTPLDVQVGPLVHRHVLIEPGAGRSSAIVVVLPDWFGRTAAQEAFGQRLAERGYAALCLDVYGEGRSATDAGEAEALMTPLVQDREALAQRLDALITAARGLSRIEDAELSVIGFCFGGLCALDLARSGRSFGVVASFHGVLGAHPTLSGRPIRSQVAVFHGWRDPIAAPEGLASLARELDSAGADWEFHCYGRAMHAFMMEQANAPEHGIMYDAAAAGSSWDILLSLLRRVHGRSDG